jgi:hypothetical protein
MNDEPKSFSGPGGRFGFGNSFEFGDGNWSVAHAAAWVLASVIRQFDVIDFPARIRENNSHK